MISLAHIASPVGEEADDAHAGGNEQVVQLILVLVVGVGRAVPALEAAEHHLETIINFRNDIMTITLVL